MKSLIIVLVSLISLNTFASFNCETDIQGSSYQELDILRETDKKEFLYNNWDSILHIQDQDRDRCFDSTYKKLAIVNGKFLWMIASGNDSCDGGNTYGVIYNYPMTKIIAEVADSTIYCLP